MYVIVTASTENCFGKDSVRVIVPESIRDSVVSFKKCSETPDGSILVFAKGGRPPYTFSMNDSPFQMNSTFSGLAYGNYQISVKDSLGCLHQTQAQISQNSNLPSPFFIASTLNSAGDTLALIDLSIPEPDSVHWNFPDGIMPIGTKIPVKIAISDTGVYSIIEEAFYGNCTVNLSKLVRFQKADSISTQPIGKGIKSLRLYPNPNQGIFTTEVVMHKKQNAILQIWNRYQGKLYEQHYSSISDLQAIIDAQQLPSDIYLFRVIGEQGAYHLYFSIQKQDSGQ
jgi:hypothetical protein